MVHGSSQVAMGETDSSERTVAKGLRAWRFTAQTKEEARLGIDEGVSETVEHDARDVAFRVEAGSRKHICQLLAYSPFILGERSGEYLRTAELALRTSRKPWFCKIDEQREHRRQVRTDVGESIRT